MQISPGRWIAMFSQTGSELLEICNKLGRWPDLIITNTKLPIDKFVTSKVPLIHHTSGKISSADYVNWFSRVEVTEHQPLYVTLHGWLRIIPPDICNQYVIFNGHPGDIVDHPELKGKDPQQKAFDLKLEHSGCIIHRAEEEVDGGIIIDREVVSIKDCKTVDAVIHRLKITAINMWKDLLEGIL